MRVVVPQDPFWAELFATVDRCVLHELSWPNDLSPAEEPLVRRAYDAYERILYQLPPTVQQLVLSHSTERATAMPGRQVTPTQRLYRADGRPLTPMYVIDVAESDLVALVAFQWHLRSDELCDLKTRVPQHLADVYHRTVGVLTLIPPSGLPEALAPARGSGDAAIVFSMDTEAAYETHRDRIIEVVSGRNPDAVACHRMLYA
ncbi:hypothetical protein [Streptomyces sp. AGS-58]|uniref:hypothetical protein n=1 Tax=unclassified Streptomyces TaxID=2593676 RepID=UPI0035A2D805